MKEKGSTVTRLDYCQYLLSSQINYTLTNFAEHTDQFSHDTINRYLAGEKITPHLVWENVKGQVEQIPSGYLVFDDTIVDKNFSFKMDLVRRQWSGDAHGVIKGVGVVTCVYVNPERDQFWIIDYRIYDPGGDGKTKLDHVHDMLENVVYHKQMLFWGILMDSWYATKDLRVMSNAPESVLFVRRVLQISQTDERWFLLARHAAVVDRYSYSSPFTWVRQVNFHLCRSLF